MTGAAETSAAPVFYPPVRSQSRSSRSTWGERSRRAVRLGMAISALHRSTSSHTASPSHTLPSTTQDRNTSRYAGTSRLDPVR